MVIGLRIQHTRKTDSDRSYSFDSREKINFDTLYDLGWNEWRVKV